MTLAEAIKARRQELGLSLRRFAQLVGVTDMSILGWESGKRVPRGLNLEKLSAAGVDTGTVGVSLGPGEVTYIGEGEWEVEWTSHGGQNANRVFLYETREEAERAYEGLRELGFQVYFAPKPYSVPTVRPDPRRSSVQGRLVGTSNGYSSHWWGEALENLWRESAPRGFETSSGKRIIGSPEDHATRLDRKDEGFARIRRILRGEQQREAWDRRVERLWYEDEAD